jgi:hypothetical protein
MGKLLLSACGHTGTSQTHPRHGAEAETSVQFACGWCTSALERGVNPCSVLVAILKLMVHRLQWYNVGTRRFALQLSYDDVDIIMLCCFNIPLKCSVCER